MAGQTKVANQKERPERPYRIEFVTIGGLTEPFLLEKFPGLFPITPTAPELFQVDQYSPDRYVIQGCNLDFALSADQLSIIEEFKEDGDIVDFKHGKRALVPERNPGERQC